MSNIENSLDSNRQTDPMKNKHKNAGFRPDRLRYMRKKRNKLVEEICKYVDVARSTYTGYEQGHRTPPPEKLVKISEILNTTPNFLCGYSDEEEPIDDNLKNILLSMNLHWDGKQLSTQQKIQIANIINGYFQSN